MPERIRPQSSQKRRVSVGRSAPFIGRTSYGIPTRLVNFRIQGYPLGDAADLGEEARALTRVARGAVRMNAQQHRIAVAVDANRSHVHRVPAGLALLPQASSRPAEERGAPGAKRRLPCVA